MAKIEKTEQQWQAELGAEQYKVLRLKGTEAPFSGEYDHVFEPGTYHCAGCGAELFVSETKYDSGCGWPAFSAPASDDAIDEETDATYGMVRTEVMCASCGGHLGHVFPDGPPRRGSATASTLRRCASRRSDLRRRAAGRTRCVRLRREAARPRRRARRRPGAGPRDATDGLLRAARRRDRRSCCFGTRDEAPSRPTPQRCTILTLNYSRSNDTNLIS